MITEPFNRLGILLNHPFYTQKYIPIALAHPIFTVVVQTSGQLGWPILLHAQLEQRQIH